ncbi:DUF882 domain-containing protein [uncultured Cohaesibacter sp.]|uniref:DUF882 domain-containing protein n=1 Tax=uncultured Cohaesibacter sp. TaxID=1002546 RepID=UPI002931DA93|nr:DUF882 domain-containing protein [uncultured Cohaesibacter sp.]
MAQKIGFIVGFLFLCFLTANPALSSTRSLNLYNAHTKESAKIVYKRDGKFDADGLRKLNQFLRDWRRNEKTEMDPSLFDLIWQVYRDTGAKQPITVFSGYRSPATNNMLRSKSKGVAKNSRHTMGMAMDFYLPGVPLDRIRTVGLKMQAGGVGYYPGSRFIHIDTGSVRHWPRMSRKQLAKVFPDGVTVHVPSDGKPFSGYKVAKAQVDKRKAAMLQASRSARRFTQYASAAPSKTSTRETQEVASLSQSDQDSGGSLFRKLLTRTPKAPPAPEFAQSQEPTIQETDEVLESEEDINQLLLPETLAALPKVRTVRIALAQNKASTDVPDPEQIIAQAKQADEEFRAESGGEAEKPFILTYLPRSRPGEITGSTQRLASIEPDAFKTPVEVPVSSQALQASAAAPAPEEVASATKGTIETSENMTLASLYPASQEAGIDAKAVPDQQTATQQTEVKEQTTDILEQMTKGTTEDKSANPTRFAYASADNTFLAILPETAPLKANAGQGDELTTMPKSANRKLLANLSGDVNASTVPPSLPKAADSLPAQIMASTDPSYGDSDELNRLTYAYGPSTMAYFAHIEQAASTARFARLSKPVPKNLRALMHKPSFVINQGFSLESNVSLMDTQFSGPAIARMATVRFN